MLTASVTARETGFGGFGGKFTTDPLALFASVLPTAAVPGTSAHLLPYAYLVVVPAGRLLWLDWRRARAGWRPLGGLLLFTRGRRWSIVDGPSQVGPLRWPLRLQPFLVLAWWCSWSWRGPGSGSRGRPGSGWRSRWVWCCWPPGSRSTALLGPGHVSPWSSRAAAGRLVAAPHRPARLGRAGVGVVTLAALAPARLPDPASPSATPRPTSAPTSAIAGAVGDVLQVGRRRQAVQSRRRLAPS